MSELNNFVAFEGSIFFSVLHIIVITDDMVSMHLEASGDVQGLVHLPYLTEFKVGAHRQGVSYRMTNIL